MWQYEHSARSTADPEDLWALFADVENWPAWNAGIDRIALEGPFASGSTVVMRPPGEEPLRMRLAEVHVPELFVDETDLGDVQVRVEHRLDRAASGGCLVTYRMQITGPAADTLGPELGPAISGDSPEVIATLIRHAEGPG